MAADCANVRQVDSPIFWRKAGCGLEDRDGGYFAAEEGGGATPARYRQQREQRETRLAWTSHGVRRHAAMAVTYAARVRME